jgi:hypothetical protein
VRGLGLVDSHRLPKSSDDCDPKNKSPSYRIRSPNTVSPPLNYGEIHAPTRKALHHCHQFREQPCAHQPRRSLNPIPAIPLIPHISDDKKIWIGPRTGFPRGLGRLPTFQDWHLAHRINRSVEAEHTYDGISEPIVFSPRDRRTRIR